MKNVYVSIIIAVMAVIALMAINLGLYAQEKVQGKPLPVQQQTGEIRLELVWEKEFEEAVTDFALDVAKDGEIYPSIIVLGSKMLILDDKSKVSGDIKGLEGGFNFFSVSESGNHIIHSWWHHDKGGKEVEECIIYIYDLAGKLIWKTSNIAPTRYPKLAPNGEYLIGPSWAEILLVKKDGTLEFINPRQSKRRSLMRIFFAISGTSEFWGISYGEPYADESVQLVTYDHRGAELFRKVMEPMGLAYDLEISNNGEMIGIIAPEKGENFIYLFDKKGNSLWKVGGISRTNQWIVFSPSDNYVLVADFGGALKCFDTSSGKVIWHHHIPKEEINITQDPGIGFSPHMEITFSPDENFVVIGGRNRKTEANCLLVVECKRGLVSTFSLPSSNRGFLPKTKFVSAGDYLYVTNDKKLLKFTLRRAK